MSNDQPSEISSQIYLFQFNYLKLANILLADFALTTFSSKGKLLQIEYALNAGAKGDTATGIKAKNGVVLVVGKRNNHQFQLKNPVFKKIALLTDNIASTYAGLDPDFRTLSQQARKLVKKYDLKCQEEIFVQKFSRKLAEDVQVATQRGGIRPFGVSILIAGYDEEGPHLVQLDPSGTYYSWKATAIGKQAKNAKAFLEKRYNADMEIEGAINTSLLALKEGFEGQITPINIDVGVIIDDHVFRILPLLQVKDYLEELK